MGGQVFGRIANSKMEMEMVRAEVGSEVAIAVAAMDTNTLIDTFLFTRPSRRKMHKDDRAMAEAIMSELTAALISRGIDPDSLRDSEGAYC